MTDKLLFSKHDIEELFERTIKDMKALFTDKQGRIYLLERKIGTLRYFLNERIEQRIKNGERNNE